MLNVGVRGISVDSAEGCVCEINLSIVNGLVVRECGHDCRLNGLFNRMITYKLYY